MIIRPRVVFAKYRNLMHQAGSSGLALIGGYTVPPSVSLVGVLRFVGVLTKVRQYPEA